MGIFDPFKNLGEAMRLADRDGDGRSVGEWFASLNMETFLWLAGMLIAAFFAATMLLGEIQIALCTHETYVMESASYNRDKKTVSIQCESCKKRLTYDAQIEVTETPASCNVEGKYNEWWTLEEVPGLGKLFTTVLPKIPHAIGEIIEAGYEPTCVSDGAEDRGVCVMCYHTVGGEKIPALGHDYYTQGYVAPTCTSTGLSGIEVCARCGDTDGKDAVIPMTEHRGVAGTFAPSYRVCGFTGTACADCGFPVLIDEVHSPALADEYFEYESTPDGEGLVITAVKKSEKSMEIPSYIDGVDVLYLGEGLFKNNETLESITLPEGLLEIGDEAFRSCTALREVTLPDSATYVGIDAFRGCSSLLSVDLGQGVSRVEANAFKECTSLLSFRFPENYNLQENYLSFSRTIPVVYNPKTTFYSLDSSNIHASRHDYAPDSVYSFKYNDTEHPVYEEDGFFYVNDGMHKVLLHCEQELVRDGILFIPEGANVLCDGLLYRVKDVDGMVLPRSVYHVMLQEWYRSERFEDGREFSVYYCGTGDEMEFMRCDGIETGSSSLMGAYVYFIFYYGTDEFYGWTYDENGLPVKLGEW